MSLDDVRRTMEAYLAALTDRGDYARFFADDISFDVLWSDTSAQGPVAVEHLIRHLHEGAFDARPEVLRLIVGEDGAAAEFSFSGTHTGEFQGIPATGRPVRVGYSSFYDVRDGRISGLRVYLPVERLVAQLRSGEPDGPAPGEGYEDWVPEVEPMDDRYERDAAMPARLSAPRAAAPMSADVSRLGSLRRMLRAVVSRSGRGASRSSRSSAR